MTAANTKECLRELAGRTVVGVLFSALPTHDPARAAGNKTLVLDDGTGLTFAGNGSFRRENREDVDRAIRAKRAELAATRRELAEVLEMAGASDVGPDPYAGERVGCDDDCGAAQYPTTDAETRGAYLHWREHGWLGGCSHGR